MIQRTPAVPRNHPADDLPPRPVVQAVPDPEPIPDPEPETEPKPRPRPKPQQAPAAEKAAEKPGQKLSEAVTFRIRPSTVEQLDTGSRKLSYEWGRNVPKAEIVDVAIREYLDKHGC